MAAESHQEPFSIERNMTKYVDDIAIPIQQGRLEDTVDTVERVSKMFGMSLGYAVDKTAIIDPLNQIP